MSAYLSLSDEVRAAPSSGQPIVALESTIITHGMPYPQNLKTARRLEEIVRRGGGVPATIAVIDGALRVGLDDSELTILAKGKAAVKASRRDLPILVARGLTGSTTVAATMIIANLAGIEVFVTGGIGGVHRGASETFDVSADLLELARTQVAVVCAGAKSILDLGLTLEVLETHGVPVLGFETERFPAFFVRDSGLEVDARVDSVTELAEIVRTKWALGLEGGVVVANPIPVKDEMSPDAVDRAIHQALDEAELTGIGGKDVTPFLLSRVERLTGGESLVANRALIENNARLGVRLAAALKARLL
ncbi:MAG: pseudouridine-5'-phosphate glycosidase [Acidobacteriota bacterium]